MNFDLFARILLGFEALACLWLGQLAWKEASQATLPVRAIGPLLGTFAAAIIVYGLVRS